MHTLAEMATAGVGTHVPAFLAKLWKLVDDATTNDLIYWSESGNSFIIRNQAKFSRDLLPLYYKHNNMASFVRQLNMYGFHKVVSVEQGGLKVDKDEMEFAHPFFLKGQETSLELIKRKIPAAKAEEARFRPDSIQKVLMDVRQMKGRQENMDSKLVTMKRENEALWRELASLRQKHAKQTQIVSKLLQFLVGMMSSSQAAPRLGFKRRMPLMLNDGETAKQRKIVQAEGGQSGSGPVIHDVTEMFTEDTSHSNYMSSANDYVDHPHVESPPACKSPYGENSLLGDPDSPFSSTLYSPADVIKPKESKNTAVSKPNDSSSNVAINANTKSDDNGAQPSSTTSTTYYLQSADGSVEPVQVVLSIPEMPVVQNSNEVSTANPTVPTSLPTTSTDAASVTTSTDIVPVLARDELDGHLDEVQLGLDNLRDILQNDDYKMDPSTLLGLFGDNELGYLELSKLQESNAQGLNESAGTLASGTGSGNSLIGQELVSYNPSLFELTEEDSQFFDDSNNSFLDDELESMLTTEKSKLSKLQSKGENSGDQEAGLTTPVGTCPPILGIPSHHTISSATPTSSSASGAGKRKRK